MIWIKRERGNFFESNDMGKKLSHKISDEGMEMHFNGTW
jgi:hypothetical protein